MEAFIVELATKYPWILTVVAIMGTLRLIMKPLMVFAHEYVLVTKTTKDDEILNKVETSKIYKAIVFVLDYVASIKVSK